MKSVLIGILIGVVFMAGLGGVIAVEYGKNQVHQERLRAFDNGVGQYSLDPQTGKPVFLYMNRDEYTHYIIQAIQAAKVQRPVNPLQGIQ